MSDADRVEEVARGLAGIVVAQVDGQADADRLFDPNAPRALRHAEGLCTSAHCVYGPAAAGIVVRRDGSVEFFGCSPQESRQI